MSRTAILIVTHNSGGHVGSCLDAVNTFKGKADSVLVIDNASTDESARIVGFEARRSALTIRSQQSIRGRRQYVI